MNNIQIHSLTMRNFRGEKDRTTSFDSQRTVISGSNGLGKSRHFDAFLWLLFGKDAQGRKDYELKTRVNGEPLSGVDVEVSAELSVGGTGVTLSRSLVEVWTKPKGQTEAVFSGNKTVCTIDGVPKTVTQYNKYIFSIIDETLFLMLTNPVYFASMPWQKQKEQLLAIVGTTDDATLAAGNVSLQELLDRLGNKQLTEYRKEIQQKKRKTREALSAIQPRIDQTHRLMPAPADWTAIEQQLHEARTKLAALKETLSDESPDKSIETFRKSLTTVKAKISNIEHFARRDAELKIEQDKSKYKMAWRTANAAKQAVDDKIDLIHVLQQKKASLANILHTAEAEREQLRGKYKDLSKLTFSTVCSFCGQELPETMRLDGERIFRDDIKHRKDKMNEDGFRLRDTIDQLNAQIKETEERLHSEEEKLRQAKDHAAELSARLDQTPLPADTVTIDLSGNEEYQFLLRQRESIELNIQAKQQENTLNEANNPHFARLKQSIAEYQQLIDEHTARLKDRDTIAQYQREISRLEAEAQRLAAEIAGYEKDECLIDSFSIARSEDMQNRIRAAFGDGISFCLYERTIDGNPVETCYPLIHGVPYNAANTAAKINAGLTIINKLCNFYGVTAPIFIDGAESVNHIVPTASQVIELKVSDEPQLTIH